MSDQLPDNKPSNDAESWIGPGRQNVQLVYILYLVSFAIGLSFFLGLVFAYLNRGNAGPLLDSHYTYQIRTFWIGLLYFVICAVLTSVGIGFLLLIFAALIWFVVRCVKGYKAITREAPIDNPKTWMV